MWPIVSTKLIKLCYGSTANTCLINRNNNLKIAKTHAWVKALKTPSSLRANETKSSQIAFSPKYCWVCKASGTDNEAAETPAWVCTSQLKSQEGVSAGKSMKILRRGYSQTRIFSDEDILWPEYSQTRLLLRLFFLCTTGLFSSSSFFIFSPRSIGIATAASYSGGPSWKWLEM